MIDGPPFDCELISTDPNQTGALGERLGAAAEAGDAFLLEGGFGAGKTVLVQGLAAGLGVPAWVTSPSFVIMNQHEGRLTLSHIDLYRAERLDADLEQTVAEVLDSGGVTAIEWPELLPTELRDGATLIRIVRSGEHERLISLKTDSLRLYRAARGLAESTLEGA